MQIEIRKKHEKSESGLSDDLLFALIVYAWCMFTRCYDTTNISLLKLKSNVRIARWLIESLGNKFLKINHKFLKEENYKSSFILCVLFAVTSLLGFLIPKKHSNIFYDTKTSSQRWKELFMFYVLNFV